MSGKHLPLHSHKKALQSWRCAPPLFLVLVSNSNAERISDVEQSCWHTLQRPRRHCIRGFYNSESVQSPSCRVHSRCILPDSEKETRKTGTFVGPPHPLTLAITLSCRPCNTPWTWHFIVNVVFIALGLHDSVSKIRLRGFCFLPEVQPQTQSFLKKTRRTLSLKLLRDIRPYACMMRTWRWYNLMLLREISGHLDIVRHMHPS